MTNKKFPKGFDDKTLGKVKRSISKVIDRPPVQSMTVFCTACTATFTAIKKDNIGHLIEQQLCPHIIFREAKYNAN